MDKSAFVGLMSGLAVVVITLIMVGVVNMPQAEAVPSRLHGMAACRQVQVAQDTGYEISRRVDRQVCEAGEAR